MTPAERLRAAANRLEALDRAATPGPWEIRAPYPYTYPLGLDTLDVYQGCTAGMLIAEDTEAGDADLIATLRGVAKPLAEWLRFEATWGCDMGDALDVAQAVATAVLGATS